MTSIEDSEKNTERHPKIDLKIHYAHAERIKYESELASGFDLRANLENSDISISPNSYKLIATGLKVEIPPGFELQIRSRSGLAAKHGVFVLNSPATIDADYRGEIKIIMFNGGTTDFTVKDKDRIAQAVLCPVFQANLIRVNNLNTTERGEGGFGSTGLN